MRRTRRQHSLIRGAVVGLLVAGALVAPQVASSGRSAGADTCPNPAAPIACENLLAGTPPAQWQVTGIGDTTIQGYATAMSVAPGGRVDLKVLTPASAYHVDIVRLGYYQGLGGRIVVSGIRPSASLPQSQPACLTNATSGLIDCGNWAVSASWTVPATAVSGVYLARLVRDDNGGASLVPFVVRDDVRASDILVQTSDTTWQAYNRYGGNSLYSCSVACPPGNPAAYKAAYKVSYNRPWHTALDEQGVNWLFYSEFPMIKFLERNGYDVSYASGIDVSSNPALLLPHKTFLSSGHDEYWSGTQRSNVEAARDAGVSLAFFSGNEVFWKTRFEPSIATGTVANRTLVTYKDTHFDAPVDPVAWTGTWADPRFSPPGDGGNPQNALTGQLFIVNAGTSAIQVPSTYSTNRLWRNTAAAALQPGQTLTLASQSLGYEWDEDADDGFRPAGLTQLSSTTVAVPEAFIDYGTSVAARTVTHHLTMYRTPSGARVFGAGTVQWSWGLDAPNTGGSAANATMQQATVNLFADMGAQPATLMSGLVPASRTTDVTPPVSTITPLSPTTVADGTRLTVSGTASDSGGVVAGVEISTDGGATWHPVNGTTSWTYSWVAHGAPTSMLRSRAADDSGNIETPAAGLAVGITCPCSLFGTNVLPQTADAGDTAAVEVGVKFRTDVFGSVTGVRFYKSAANTGAHVGNLWSSTGALLARASFAGETSSGWQQVSFSPPVTISPGNTYVASYFAPVGRYSQSPGFFYPPPAPAPDGNSSVDSPPLHALRNSAGVTNGVYAYGSSTTFPAQSFNAENYWVDPLFVPSPPPGQVGAVNATPGNGSATVSWAAPPAGGPVTTYTVTPYAGLVALPGTAVTGNPASTSALVGGLTNGTAYTFTVTASNPVGTAAPSSPSAPVTPSVNAALLANGGFEFGLAGWSGAGTPVPEASTARAHSGGGSALIGQLSGPEATGNSTLSLPVAVPTGTSNLSFWYWPVTTDALCTTACQWDWEEAQVRTPAGATLATIFKGNSNAQAWTNVTFNMSPYAGQSVVLWFSVHGDGAVPPDDTAMFLDDVFISGGAATVAGAPTGVTAVAGNAQATVSWTAPADGGSGLTSYVVTPYVGAVAQAGRTVVGTPPVATTVVPGLTNGTAYTFRVAAVNAVGTGAASAPSTSVTPIAPTVPGAPTSVTATAGSGQATVAWAAPSNGGSAITAYVVTPFVGAVPQPATTVSGSPPATTVTIPGLLDGTAYTFRVAAVNALGTGAQSAASAAVTPTGPTAPSAPTGVTATAGNAQANVTWVAPANGGSTITSYAITPFVGGVAQTPTTVTGNPPGAAAVVSGLTNGTTYTFTVTAANLLGAGPASGLSAPIVPTAPTVPAAPSGVVATAGNAQASVSWTAPADGASALTSYVVTPRISGVAQPATTVTGAPPATSVVVPGLVNGTAYTFTVVATNAVGAGPASLPSAAVTPTIAVTLIANGGFETNLTGWTAAGTPVPARSTARAHTGVGSVLLGQLSGAEATGNSTMSLPLTIPAGTSNLSFWYWPVTTDALCTAACQWDWEEAQVRTPAGATLATIFKGNSNAQAWTNVTFDTTPYAGQAVVLWFSVHGDGAVPPDDTAMYLDDVLLTAAPPTAPGSPTGVVAVPGNGQATVSWVAPASGGSPITSYVVTPFASGVAQTPTTLTGSPPATASAVTGLTNGTQYAFTVRAVNTIGPGPASPTSALVTPSAAVAVVANGGFESALAGWQTGGTPPAAASTARAHSGTGSALVGQLSGAEATGDGTMSQTITVPVGSPSLSFWYWPITTDGLCTTACQWDWEEAQIRTTAGATLATVFKGNSNAQAWTNVTFSLAPYAGQTVVLWFNVHGDGAVPPDDTAMFVDDVLVTP